MKNTENVINSWREYLAYQNKTLKQGVDEMNETLDRNVLPGHISEYKKELRKMHPDILRYLCDEVFIFAIIKMDLKGLELRNLMAWKQMASLPRRKR